jgi:hypothetical protein
MIQTAKKEHKLNDRKFWTRSLQLMRIHRLWEAIQATLRSRHLDYKLLETLWISIKMPRLRVIRI